jgi:8-oxo-dGTP pyrophosphatase MutT (NUDIX family)
VILHEDKLLVVKHSPEDTFVALPGGHLEWSEDIKECLKREMIEELGVAPEIGRLLYINNLLIRIQLSQLNFSLRLLIRMNIVILKIRQGLTLMNSREFIGLEQVMLLLFCRRN